VAILHTAGPLCEIDTFLMSCRVIGRTAEEFCLNALLERAKSLGYQRLLGHYIPTKKNALVKDLYPRLGFRLIESVDSGAANYEMNLLQITPAKTFVAAGRHAS